MGMLLKSAIGLGAVYFAMFGAGDRSADIGPAANLCASAARARLEGDAALRAQWSAAGCVREARRRAAGRQRAAAKARRRRRPAAEGRRRRAAPRPHSGTLTEADLAEPWFGPARYSTKIGHGEDRREACSALCLRPGSPRRLRCAPLTPFATISPFSTTGKTATAT